MITTSRRKFLGIHVTPDLKQALEKEAASQQISVSKLTFMLLLDKLRGKGHQLQEEK